LVLQDLPVKSDQQDLEDPEVIREKRDRPVPKENLDSRDQQDLPVLPDPKVRKALGVLREISVRQALEESQEREVRQDLLDPKVILDLPENPEFRGQSGLTDLEDIVEILDLQVQRDLVEKLDIEARWVQPDLQVPKEKQLSYIN
jgi:hypothetical protein